MKHLAFGWACNFKDLFVRFPYNKCKYLFKRKGTKQKVNQIFRTGLEVIVNDIVENGVTFKLPGFQYYGGEFHFEHITGEEFKRVRNTFYWILVIFLQSWKKR